MEINNNGAVYVYTGNGQVPRDVVRVWIHPSLGAIPDEAFLCCTQLKEVVLSEGLQTIGGEAFCGCTALESIQLPSTVIEINEQAFHGCSGLKEVKLCEGITTIGGGAFRDCNSLKFIEIPSTVTEIGLETFVNCYELKEVKLCEGLKTIGTYAFSDCRSLERINIPSTLESIGDAAFVQSFSLNRDSIVQIFSKALCDKSSINATYSSNHNLTSLGLDDDDDQEREFDPLLELNRISNKGQVAAIKILRYHDRLDMKPLLEWYLKCLPFFVAWVGRAMSYLGDDDEASDTVGSKKLGAIYQFVRGSPSELEGLGE